MYLAHVCQAVQIVTVLFKVFMVMTRYELLRRTKHLNLFGLACLCQRRQSGLKSGGSWIRVQKSLIFQALSQKILIFPGKFSKDFDFNQAILEKTLIFQAKLAIYSCFWANYSISLQKLPLSNILIVHDKI